MLNNTLNGHFKIEKINKVILSIFPFLFIPLGILFNGITFYIYTRKTLIKTSAGFYFSVLAIVETLALLSGSLKYSTYNLWNFHPHNYSIFLCKFNTTATYILCQMASWILVIISIDRLILIKYPYKFVGTKFIKIRIAFIVSIFFIITIINIPNLIFLDLISVNISNQSMNQICIFDSLSYDQININLIDLFLTAIIPFIIMMFSGVVAAIIILNSKNKISQSTVKPRRKYRFLSTIIARNLLFLVFNLPICLTMIINNLRYQKYIYIDFVFTISNIFVYANFAFSLFVHLIFNDAFYNIFIKIFKKNPNNFVNVLKQVNSIFTF